MRASSLVSKNTRSCGCLHKETTSNNFKTHGMTGTPTYKSWQHLKARCLDETNPAYKDYGGRGITVCDRWKDSFENFYEDMGECPKGLTIDRTNNELGYYKENCKWITRKEQNNNRRDNIMITYKGVTKSLSLFCEELNLKYSTILARIKKHNWSVEDALEIKDCKNRIKN